MPSPIMAKVDAHVERLGRKQIEVEEWGDDGKPLTIYAPPISIIEMNKWYKGITNDNISILVDLIVAKSEDVNGKKLFTLEDKPLLLRKAPFNLISRIAGEMMDTDDPETIEKN